jgi:hypothetical protein
VALDRRLRLLGVRIGSLVRSGPQDAGAAPAGTTSEALTTGAHGTCAVAARVREPVASHSLPLFD